MFEELKKKKRRDGLSAKAITAWFLFGAIIIVFIFLDMNKGGSRNVGSGGAAASVNSRIISQAAVAEQTQNLRSNPYFAQGAEDLSSRALQSLINSELISQSAEKQGLLVPKMQIADTIRDIEVFQEEGRFRRERYQNYLTQTRKTAGEFEEQLRKDQIRMRAVRMISLALRPSPLEVERQAALQNLKANTEFVAVPTEAAVKVESIPANDVAEFLKTPEGTKKAKDYYEAHKNDEFSTQEEVNARHILIKNELGGGAAAEAKSLEKAKAVRARLEKEDFAKVAKEVSDDPGSKAKGGELGFFSRGRMVPEFENAAFSLEAKKISDPVKSAFGYHIIQVVDKRPAKTTSFEEAQDRIARKLIAAERSEKALDEVRELVKKGDMPAVNQWVQKNGLKWEETGAFGIDSEMVPKIGPNAEFADAAFRLTSEKPLLDKLIRQGPSTYIVRYKNVAVASGSSKDKTKGQSQDEPMKPEMLREVLANQRSTDAFNRWVKRLRETSKISVAEQYKTSAQN